MSRRKWNEIDCQDRRFKIYLNDEYPVDNRMITTDDYDYNGDPIVGGTYSTGGAAWWLNKVSKDYDKCIDVYRFSDNTVRTFGFDEKGNLEVDNIENWLQGSIGLISKWWDQSGNENHLIQPNILRMPHIADENGKVFLRRCRPCALFFVDEFSGKWMFLEREYDSVNNIQTGFELNPILSNLSVFSVAEMNYTSGSQSDAAFLVGKEVYDSSTMITGGGVNNFSLRINHNSVGVQGYLNAGTSSSPQAISSFTASTTPPGNCDIWNYFIYTTEPVTSPQFPDGVRQEIRLDKFNTIGGAALQSPLLRPENSFIGGAVPFTLGASLLNNGSYVNWENRGAFLKGSGVNPRPREWDGVAGVQGLSYYTSDKRDDKLNINFLINRYWNWY
jgi:hypothetical protein